jgi:hypothetical protein
MKNNKGLSQVAVVLLVVAIIIIGSIAYFAGKNSNTTPLYTPVSDNSQPTPVTPPTDKPVGDLSATFPDIYSEGYYHSQDWKLTTAAGQFSCTEASGATPGEEKVVKKTINNNLYCIHSSTGAAAGTAYTEYKYESVRFGKLISISFTFGEVNCSNYDEPRQTACVNAETKINNSLDSIIDQTFATIK